MRGAGNKILELDYKAFTHYVATHRTKKKKTHFDLENLHQRTAWGTKIKQVC